MTDPWTRGREGEAIARKWLTENGYIVIAASDIDNGGAPMLLEKRRKIILPDNVVFHAGQPSFVEVKTYEKAVWEAKRQRWHHGILKRHFENYMLAAKDCGIPCYLAVVQVDLWMLLLGELAHLAETALDGLAPSKFGWETYFDINRFEWFSLKGLPGVTQLPSVPPETKHPWDKPAQMVRQGTLFIF